MLRLSSRIKIKLRTWHAWLAFVFATPLLLLLITGALLQLRGHWAWLSPTQLRGTAGIPQVTAPALVALAESIPDAQVRDWRDIQRIELNPGRGVAVVRTKSGWDIQIDAQSGKILGAGPRKAGLILALHEGYWFHKAVPLAIFFPTALVMILVALSGALIFLTSPRVRRTR